jgi:hypothetical protein
MRFLAFFIVSFVSFLKINKNILKKLSSQIFLKKNNRQTIKQKYGLRSGFLQHFFPKTIFGHLFLSIFQKSKKLSPNFSKSDPLILFSFKNLFYLEQTCFQ